MSEREQRLYVIYELIIEGYSRAELVKMMQNGELFDEAIPQSTAYKLIADARELCKIEPEESDILYSRLLAIYKGCMAKTDYGNAIKAVKELKEFSNTDNSGEVTIKFIKE